MFYIIFYHGRLSAKHTPTSHLVFSCVHVLRRKFQDPEVSQFDSMIVVNNDDSDDDDNANSDTNDDDTVNVDEEAYLYDAKLTMLQKFNKYFATMPAQFIVGSILDPRVKLRLAIQQDKDFPPPIINLKKNGKQQQQQIETVSTEQLFRQTITSLYERFYAPLEEDEEDENQDEEFSSATSILNNNRSSSVKSTLDKNADLFASLYNDAEPPTPNTNTSTIKVYKCID